MPSLDCEKPPPGATMVYVAVTCVGEPLVTLGMTPETVSGVGFVRPCSVTTMLVVVMVARLIPAASL